MKKPSRSMMVLGAGGLLAGSVLLTGSASAGAVGPAVSAPELATSQDVVRQSSSVVQLSATGGVPTAVIYQSLPAGSWVLSANASLVSWAPSDYTRCNLYVGDTIVGGATAMVGDPGAGSAGTGTYVATVSLQGAFTSAADAGVSLRCGHDRTQTTGGLPYVDPGATLWAHRSDGLGPAKRGR